MACAPGATLVAISSRWSCMASQLQAGTRGGAGSEFGADRAEQIGRLGRLIMDSTGA
jgi:hypothetical protein